MFIVQICPSFGDFGSGSAGGGLGSIGGNGIVAAFGSGLLSTATGTEKIASLLAHEIGHNLGLNHVSTAENLMRQGVTGERLDAVQIQTVLDSPFTIAIPEPSAFVLLFGAGLVFGLRRKRP